jgi:iron complex outermembrane receptor protein
MLPLVALCGMAFAPDWAAAQTAPAAPTVSADASALQEIVVTATRRETNLQDTPLAVTALGGQDLRSEQLTDVQSLASRVPGLQFGQLAVSVNVFIRGVGSDDAGPGGDSRIALYTDGIYQARAAAALVGFYDIDRVEVLRGPQGTLYGRNATGGAINIISKEPTNTLDGYVAQTFGNYGEVATEGAIGGGLTDTLSARVAFKTEDHNGYGVNISNGDPVNDLHTRAVRLKLKYEPSSSLTVHLNSSYFNEDDSSGAYKYIGEGLSGMPPAFLALGGVAPSNPQDAAGSGPRTHLETYGSSLEADWQITETTKLVSLSGYSRFRHNLYTNLDDSTANLTQEWTDEYAQEYTQEFRLSQSFGEFADAILGAYYFNENHFAGNKLPLAGVLFGAPTVPFFQGYETQGVVNTNAPAGFGQVNFHLTDKLGLTLGARYSHERDTLREAYQLDLARTYAPANPFIPSAADQQKTSASKFDPLATVNYKFSDAVYGYATFSRGFKSGGFNIGGLQPPFQPETLTDYEIGLKTELWDKKLRANISAFLYDYTNLQVGEVVGIVVETLNAASSRIKGLEGEFTLLPIENLRLNVNAAYLDAKYLSFSSADNSRPELGVLDLRGNSLNLSPKFKINGEIGYTFHPAIGDVTPKVDVTWTDKVYFTPYNLAEESQVAYTNVDAFASYVMHDTGWRADLYVKNLTDKIIALNSVLTSNFLGPPAMGTWSPPRTFGIQITKTF